MMRAYIEAGLRPLRKRVANLEGLSRSQSVDGWETNDLTSLAAEPAERLYQGRVMYCTDCRKSGEGAAAGTGLPVYFDSSGATWRNVFDNAAATS